MAKLYFRHGAMGSSKTANALMVAYNYYERGKQALLVKPRIDTRDVGVIRSRMGLEQKCIYVEELQTMDDEEILKYDCVIGDEAQFCKKEEIELFVHIVDELERPLYMKAALNILKSCEAKFCNWDPERDSIVTGGTYFYHDPDGTNTEVPIIYGDYYFIEAILKLKDKELFIW